MYYNWSDRSNTAYVLYFHRSPIQFPEFFPGSPTYLLCCRLFSTNPDIVYVAAQGALYGPNTERALARYLETHGVERAIKRYAALRLRYYKQLRHFRTFGRGWTRRTNEVKAEGLKWQKQA